MSQHLPSERLGDLADRYWQTFLAFNPTYATSLGHRAHDHRLPDASAGARAQYFADLRGIAEDLDALGTGGLHGEDVITHEALATTLRQELAAEPHRDDRWAINPLFGTHVWMAELASRQPTESDEALDRLRQRLAQIPTFIDQELVNLREGLDLGQTAFEVAVDRTLKQIDRILSAPRESTAFLPPGLRGVGPRPDVSEAAAQALNDTIDRSVLPALARYRAFLADTYAPRARSTPGLHAMPGGDAFYRYTISYFTGRNRDPQAVHQIGLEEIARLQEEMKAIAAEVTQGGDLAAFTAHLRGRSDQTAPTSEAIVAFNEGLLARAQARLPEYFDHIPSHTCQVRPIEAFREADSPAGYYDRAPGDGSRPAYYYVNTHNPAERPLYNMEALAFHEAVPGHHLQIALAQELERLPEFRRHLGETAYIEGWALYSERLADEMGLYSGPLARFGMLNFQAWRAARLVVDTGLHALGWPRQRAIDFLREVTGFGEGDAAIEVDRYIVMPGQALAYMLGRMEIDGMRARAEERLGARFDIRDFHAQILNHGALPLASLSRLMEGWLPAP